MCYEKPHEARCRRVKNLCKQSQVPCNSYNGIHTNTMAIPMKIQQAQKLDNLILHQDNTPLIQVLTTTRNTQKLLHLQALPYLIHQDSLGIAFNPKFLSILIDITISRRN